MIRVLAQQIGSRAAGALMLTVLLASACTSGSPSAAPASAAPTPSGSSGSVPPATTTPSGAPSVAPTAWRPDPNCKSTDPVVTKAIENTIARTGPQDKWYGPTEGPRPEPGVKAVYIATDARNALALSWGQNIVAAGQKINWDVSMIDGKGTAEGWTAAMTQAIALKARVIMYSADAPTLKDLNRQAVEQGIKVIGIHGTALPGPDESVYLFTNITSDPREIATAMAEYAIADSCGTAKVIIEYDSAYQIATMKGETMKAVMETCKTCTILEYINSPLAELETRQPQLCSNWATKYGKGWYAMTVYDGVWDFCVPALQSAGIGPADVKLIASDGTLQGYERIRSGQYQVMTVPEPSELFAYAALDDAIRAVAGLPPAYGTGPGQWTQPVFIHFKDPAHGDNLSTEGGDQNQFFPSNDYVNRYLKLWGVGS
jgi:ribose transport system substrate-binding protein